MRKTYKFQIAPTPQQAKVLDRWLYLCRRLYNAMLEQRIIVWRQRRKGVSQYDQMRELGGLKAELPEYAELGSQVLQDVAKRLDKSFQRFFQRGAGFPKFQGRNRYDSFTYTQAGWKIKDSRLVLTKCGAIKVHWSRAVEGDIKTITIKRRAGRWFVCFSCDNVPVPAYPATTKKVGIDLGIEALATTSDGERLENAQYLKRKLRHLRRIQRHLARQKKGSNRRKKTVLQLQRLHAKIANQRADAHHKASTKLVREYAEIHMEHIDPQFMLANRRLARAAADVGWSQFKTFLQSKAAAAGRKIVEKSARNTSQECSGCGRLVPKKLHVRWHRCPFCGTSLDRDHNAAIVILNRAS